MKRALIIIAIILLIAAVVGLVFLGGLMMNNYAQTGSVFGSTSNISGSFWENIIGDEILNEVRPDVPTGNVSDGTDKPDIDQSGTTPTVKPGFTYEETNRYLYTLLEDGTYSITFKTPNTPDGVLTVPESFNGAPVTVISGSERGLTYVKTILIPDTVTKIESKAFENFSILKKVVF